MNPHQLLTQPRRVVNPLALLEMGYQHQQCTKSSVYKMCKIDSKEKKHKDVPRAQFASMSIVSRPAKQGPKVINPRLNA